MSINLDETKYNKIYDEISKRQTEFIRRATTRMGQSYIAAEMDDQLSALTTIFKIDEASLAGLSDEQKNAIKDIHRQYIKRVEERNNDSVIPGLR